MDAIERLDGTVIKVLQDKQFGFIRASDGREYFFHATSIKTGTMGQFAPGTLVTFEPTNTTKGLRAEQVTWVD